MSDAPGTNFESNEADRLEQSIDAERPELDDQDLEAPAHLRDRAAESSLEANPADLEEQSQEVPLDDDEEGSTLEQE